MVDGGTTDTLHYTDLRMARCEGFDIQVVALNNKPV